jgi:CHASE1-domain containing sensor protein
MYRDSLNFNSGAPVGGSVMGQHESRRAEQDGCMLPGSEHLTLLLTFIQGLLMRQADEGVLVLQAYW